MEVDPGRKKALYELHKLTRGSHDSGDDDNVELFKELSVAKRNSEGVHA